MKKTVKYLIEAVIILAVIAVGIYAYSIINPKKNDKELKDVEITVEFMQIRKEFIEDIKVGDKVVENMQHSVFGEVLKVYDLEESVVLVKDYEKGEYIETTSDKYFQRKIVLKTKAKITDSSVKVGDCLVKIGGRIGFIFNDNLADGTIMKIDFMD